MSTHSAEERYTSMYAAWYPHVFAYCARRTGRSEAEDIANEVFLVLWRRIATFDDENPLPWLYRVAHGLVRNNRRSRTRKSRLLAKLVGSPIAVSESAEVLVVRREIDQRILFALGRLSGKDQEVLCLAVWEGLSASEIGAVMDCSTAAAQQRYSRAKRRLAKLLSPLLSSQISSPALQSERQ